MRIRIVGIGGRAPDWVDAGFESYRRRLGRAFDVELDIVRPPPGGGGEGGREREGERLLERAAGADLLVALDEHGAAPSTRELAVRVDGWRQRHRHVCLLIGGADGLSAAVLARAHERLSLSRLTLPHALVRIVVIEQIYRVATLLAGHPYHRD
jgi:23S rRNA (pseudouridine1915-N3)-methyltransferase